jgi:hypothetical protein
MNIIGQTAVVVYLYRFTSQPILNRYLKRIFGIGCVARYIKNSREASIYTNKMRALCLHVDSQAYWGTCRSEGGHDYGYEK